MHQEFYWIAVAVVTVLSSARLTRLAVYDEFPPAMWLRGKYEAKTEGTGWKLLALCGFCASFWVTVFVMAWADLSGVFDHEPVADWMTPLWWLVNGCFGASYLAAMTVARDGDE